MATYKGKYKVKNPKKYAGDASNVIYRSLWERNVFRWMDENSQVIKWSSEEVVIPYYYDIDKKYHRYFVDLKFTTLSGTYLVEIKPKNQTVPPKKPSRQTKKYLTEVASYVKNQNKWHAAEKYAKERGWTFVVWTEDEIRGLGITLL